MPSATRTDVVVTGATSVSVATRAELKPARWVAAPAKLARMDRLCGLALVAADGALADAALSPADAGTWDSERTAVVLGTAYGCHATNEDYYRGLLAQGPAGASPRLFAYTLPSSPVGEISIHYGIRGPAVAIAPGRTAGIDVIGAALRELSAGRADRVLAVAADVATPFIEKLTGEQGLSDGSAALLLERTAAAAARGATPRGRILAVASSYAASDRASAVREAARQALAAAELQAGSVRRVLGAALDLAALQELDLTAQKSDDVPAALGAAPLIAAARWLQPGRGLLLLVAGDPEGAGSAALLEPA
jgi:3-oxoacyl-[acyl-carrier-protein] synthase II